MDKSCDLNPIIKKLEESKSVAEDGRIAYRDLWVDDLGAVLEGSVEFSPQIPERERHSIVRKALFSPAAKKVLTQPLLLAELKKLESEYLATNPQPFILATSISVPHQLRIPRHHFNGVSMIFSRSLPKRFKREQYEKDFLRNGHDSSPPNYQSVRLRVQARSKSEAIDKAIDALDFLRGCWNYGINRRIGYQFQMSVQTPVNQIRLGQVHTLHLQSGDAADESYLYEPSFVLNKNPESMIGVTWLNAKKDEQQIRPLLRKSSYAADFVTAITRYCRALDLIDYESAYIRLWSLLEFLTGTVDGKTHELINRCLFVFANEDRDVHRQILYHLREKRHGFVHSGKQTVTAYALVWQLKRYVERMLLFHLRRTGEFKTRHDAVNFLSLPFAPDEIRKRIRQLRSALKYRT